MNGDRTVVLLTGPPGAGKSTLAHQSGMVVYDRDDEHWPDERAFTAALKQVGADPNARACVIRTAPSSSARAKAARLIGATHVFLVTASAADLGDRISHRGRADTRGALAAIKTWHDRHDRGDGVRPFPGWQHLGSPNVTLGDEGSARPALGSLSRAW